MIVKLTDEVAGESIVDDPIKLTVFSPECPDLTLIDLPGITRVAMKGHPANIEEITVNMAGRYCKEDRTIILCVINANQDMATSDGIKLAKEFDPTGERTIGVITKIDIMDKGTDARKMIMNEEIKFKLGFIGIKNRCQEDIINKVPVSKSLEDEAAYFRSHEVYSSLPPNLLGTRSLTTKLSNLLMKNIGK